jgi:hypothetical protein
MKLSVIYVDQGITLVHRIGVDGPIGDIEGGCYHPYSPHPELDVNELRRIADWLDIIQGGGNPIES